MNALLVYPQFPDTFWSFRHALKFIRKKASSPPLGLVTIAALLPPAWEKRIIDLNTNHLDDEDIAWADMVFVSAMVVQRDSASDVIYGQPGRRHRRLCRAANRPLRDRRWRTVR